VQKYKFTEDNPMSALPDALAEGRRRLAEGDIPSAVLCFEAAAAAQPDNAEVWQLLGTTQAQNEQVTQTVSQLDMF
jgi:peroxin-5